MPIRTILISRTRCCLAPGQCVLTFDDGPAGKVTDDLLAVLHQFGVKACFCLVGSQVAMRAEQTRAIASAGHLLVNHTYHHQFTDLYNLEKFSLDWPGATQRSATRSVKRTIRLDGFARRLDW